MKPAKVSPWITLEFWVSKLDLRGVIMRSLNGLCFSTPKNTHQNLWKPVKMCQISESTRLYSSFTHWAWLPLDIIATTPLKINGWNPTNKGLEDDFPFQTLSIEVEVHSHAHQNHTAQRALPGVVEASMNVYQRTWSFDVRETMAVIRKKTKNSQHDRAKQSHHHAFFPGKMHTHLFWNLRP